MIIKIAKCDLYISHICIYNYIGFTNHSDEKEDQYTHEDDAGYIGEVQ